MIRLPEPAQGVKHPTVPELVVNLVLWEQADPAKMWRDLHTTLSLDDALALRDIMEVGISRSHAQARNEYAKQLLRQPRNN
ncbi:MAG: hypothetical protein VYA51_12775 [Planctomycetota bacterium]|nr:hypothetical protein [Planctomycetota bacterium]